MPDFEIRYFHVDGSLAMVRVTSLFLRDRSGRTCKTASAGLRAVRSAGNGSVGTIVTRIHALSLVNQGIIARSLVPTFSIGWVAACSRSRASPTPPDAFFVHPGAREASRLDIAENALHLGFRFGIDHTRSGFVGAAVFGGIGDRLIHAGNPARVHEIDQQLELMESAFEIGEFGAHALLRPACRTPCAPTPPSRHKEPSARRTDRFRSLRGNSFRSIQRRNRSPRHRTAQAPWPSRSRRDQWQTARYSHRR